MFDIGLVELFLVGALALVLIGPKELPDFLRNIGRLFARLRRFYRDSLESFEQLQREVTIASQSVQKPGAEPVRDPLQQQANEASIETAIERAREQMAGKV